MDIFPMGPRAPNPVSWNDDDDKSSASEEESPPRPDSPEYDMPLFTRQEERDLQTLLAWCEALENGIFDADEKKSKSISPNTTFD